MKFRKVTKSFIITAFTLAAALIWRDWIAEVIQFFAPENSLSYKFLATLVATILILVAIFILLKTEEGMEHVLYKNHNGKNGTKK